MSVANDDKHQAPAREALGEPTPRPGRHLVRRVALAPLRWIWNNPLRALCVGAMLALIGGGSAVGILFYWADSCYQAAEAALAKQDFEEAYRRAVQSLSVWGNSPETHLLAAQSARRAGRPQEAAFHLDECQRLQDGRISPVLQRERLLLRAQSGDYDGIERTLLSYAEENPAEAPLIYEALTKGYWVRLRLPAVQWTLDKLLKRDPNNATAWYWRGILFTYLNNSDDAEKAFEKALGLNPAYDDARFQLASQQIERKPMEARRHFEFLVRKHPENVFDRLGLAQVHKTVGDYKKALPLLDDILRQDPNNPAALLEKGMVLLLESGPAEAEASLRQAVKQDPYNPQARYQLSHCLSQLPAKNQVAEALPVKGAGIVSLMGSSLGQGPLLAAAALVRKRTEAEEALAAYKRLVADNARLVELTTHEINRMPDDAEVRCEVGILLLRTGQHARGIGWLFSALDRDPNHRRSHRAIIQYYERTGQGERAAAHRAMMDARLKN